MMHLIAPPGTSIEKERQSEIQSEGNEKECSTWPLAVKLSWTTMHVIDHKMFIAARRIQSYWRAYRIRNLLHRRWHAAVVIQRWWRGFRIRRILWELVERRLQHTLHEHFNQAAIRIQALFRGWQDRRYVHDVQNLHGMQTSAAEELISCFILQFHQIKKTESLPGLFSLRNSVPFLTAAYQRWKN
ncbi:spermatogenesis-associated protein 17 isoform X2 [Drosophila eugracilis]|uniref:spermatogenesis-associated protein 17 isoform X2 n=1 Tax=Drosophila eugracilis TaxID=29029 RepID=UPI001BD97CAA|nr:spermatogenesis-associated protein 17 isoform X2 [Drosophila eugracilis]